MYEKYGMNSFHGMLIVESTTRPKSHNHGSLDKLIPNALRFLIQFSEIFASSSKRGVAYAVVPQWLLSLATQVLFSTFQVSWPVYIVYIYVYISTGWSQGIAD